MNARRPVPKRTHYSRRLPACRISEDQLRDLPSRAVLAGFVRGEGRADVSGFIRHRVFETEAPPAPPAPQPIPEQIAGELASLRNVVIQLRTDLTTNRSVG